MPAVLRHPVAALKDLKGDHIDAVTITLGCQVWKSLAVFSPSAAESILARHAAKMMLVLKKQSV